MCSKNEECDVDDKTHAQVKELSKAIAKNLDRQDMNVALPALAVTMEYCGNMMLYSSETEEIWNHQKTTMLQMLGQLMGEISIINWTDRQEEGVRIYQAAKAQKVAS